MPIEKPSRSSQLSVSIPQAAKIIGIKRSWAHEYFRRLHDANPDYGLLTRRTENGKWRVELQALFELKRGSGLAEMQELSGRIGMLEADYVTLKKRLENMQTARDLDSKKRPVRP